MSGPGRFKSKRGGWAAEATWEAQVSCCRKEIGREGVQRAFGPGKMWPVSEISRARVDARDFSKRHSGA